VRGLAAGGLTAAVAYRAVAAAMSSRPPAGLRTNHRGREVSLAAGPAVVAGTLAGTAAACPSGGARQLRASLIAVLTAAAAGGYDDLAGTSHARGLRGHLGALLDGEVTTGSAKIVGIGVGALSAARGLGGSGGDVLLATGLIAGTANLVNLLDLRPGRAGKAALLAAGLVLTRARGWPAAGVAGATAAMLPADLGERVMLGDTGANALGAALGTAIAAAADRPTRIVVFAAVVALTELSERMSFSAGIEAIPALRWLDSLGRLA